MNTNEWQTGKPPHNEIVEVDDDRKIVRVRAIWGSDGVSPHWESEDQDTLWGPSAFHTWRRPVSDEETTDEAAR